jgi:hypothetical protein
VAATVETFDHVAELKRYTDCASCDPELVKKFLEFKFLCSTIETPEDVKNYQCPSGSLKAFTTRDMAWPPLNKRSRNLTSFD